MAKFIGGPDWTTGSLLRLILRQAVTGVRIAAWKTIIGYDSELAVNVVRVGGEDVRGWQAYAVHVPSIHGHGNAFAGILRHRDGH